MYVRRRISCLISVLFFLTTSHGERVLCEQNGYVVVEIENAPAGEWSVQTEWTGFTGTGYYQWDGPDYFDAPPGNNELLYTIRIQNAGKYKFEFRNQHRHPDMTGSNDHWVSVDGSPHYKMYSHDLEEWTWNTHPDQGISEFDLQAGEVQVSIQPRSNGMALDRFILFTESREDQARSAPESTESCSGGDPTSLMTPTRSVSESFHGARVYAHDGRYLGDCSECGNTMNAIAPGGAFLLRRENGTVRVVSTR